MAMKNLKSLSQEEKVKFINSFDTVFSDCDGVLWLASNPISKAPETMNAFKKDGKNIFYLTNNGMKTPEDLSTKLKNLGFDATSDEVLCTAMLTADYLKSKNFNKTAYLVAPPSVKSEIDKVGIANIGLGPDVLEGEVKELREFKFDLDPKVGAVVVGYDVHFSYVKLMKAAAYLSSPDIEFVATNTDSRFPVSGGRLIPGAGSFVRAVETASGRTPMVVGKPSTLAFECVKRRTNLDPSRTLMIGDRCETDITFGKNTGMQTLLVLTGVHKTEDVERFKKEGKDNLIPDYYTDSIGDLLELLQLCKK